MIMKLRCFENGAGMLAIKGSKDVFMTKMEIELAIEKFGDYWISKVIIGKEVVFNTNLPYHLYQVEKDAIRCRRNQMS